MKVKRTPDAQRLADARKAAAEELHIPATDWRVRRYEALALAFERHEALLATGAEINVDKLLSLNTAMQEIRATVPPPQQTITVEYIKPTDATPDGSGVCGLEACRHCGWKPHSPKDFLSQCPMCGWTEGCDTARLPTGPRLPPAQIDGDAVEVVDSEPAPEIAPKANSGRTKALPKPSEHELMLRRDLTPDDWKRHVAPNDSGGNPYGVGGEPHPYLRNGHDRSGHTLPTPGKLVW